jgi:UDP-N-acetylmuramate: L-alanyl-gamma-D-glutamyl-meso-diaminopimelate ligase
MKLGVMAAQLPASLDLADRVFCYVRNLGWNVAEVLSPLGQKVVTFDDIGQLVAAVSAEAQAGDRIVVMSNGGFEGVHERLLQALQVQ